MASGIVQAVQDDGRPSALAADPERKLKVTEGDAAALLAEIRDELRMIRVGLSLALHTDLSQATDH